MKISRFQLRLTLAFVLLIAIPVVAMEVISVKLIGYSMGLRSGREIERALEGALELLRNMISAEKQEALSIASGLSSGVLTEAPEGWELVRISRDSAFALIPERSRGDLVKSLESGGAVSFQVGGYVYGISPPSREKSEFLTVYRDLDDLLENAAEIASTLTGYRRLTSMESDLSRLIGLISLVGGMVLLLAAIFAAAAFARSVTKPIGKLVEGTREVANDNLDYRIEPGPKDEIGELVNSFNIMAEDLKSGREKLLRAERIAAWRDVARAIAHEIKNPLTPIQLSLKRLRKRLEGIGVQDKGADESFDIINRQLDALRDMASEFSNFARMPRPEFKPTHLNGVISEIISFYRSSETDISFVTDLGSGIPAIQADPGQLGRVFGNIVKNSVDAMPEGGEISVETGLQGDYIEVEFRDNGPGIPEDVLRKVFDPYFTTKSRGTGLGLAIVQQIVESHGGGIHIESEAGKGTKVTLRFPIEGD